MMHSIEQGDPQETTNGVFEHNFLVSLLQPRRAVPGSVRQTRQCVAERAMVLCVDEKSQVQALDRTQPLLPMRPGQPERRSHDYKRHGTTSLFAALDVKTGTIIGKCMVRHRAQEFRKFLDEVERNVPADLDIHIVMDNYGTHKTKLIRDWFAKRRRLARALHAHLDLMDQSG